MSSPATYQIRVRGILTDQWADWFNGTLRDPTQVDQGRLLTNLSCKVRDQAELLGILKQLNALNLPLIQVILIDGGQNRKGGLNDEI